MRLKPLWKPTRGAFGTRKPYPCGPRPRIPEADCRHGRWKTAEKVGGVRLVVECRGCGKKVEA